MFDSNRVVRHIDCTKLASQGQIAVRKRSPFIERHMFNKQGLGCTRTLSRRDRITRKSLIQKEVNRP
jgi:hypothetical protein